MKTELSPEENEFIKKSFFSILSLFLSKGSVESRYVACLLKWSAQLSLSNNDLHMIEEEYDKIPFEYSSDKISRVEAIYSLVHMIYLDNIVEDIELEVATIYAQNLGFDRSIVAELFKSIATAPFDGQSHAKLRDEVEDFMKIYEKRDQ